MRRRNRALRPEWRADYFAANIGDPDGYNIENLGLLVGQLAYGSGFGNRGTLRAYVAS